MQRTVVLRQVDEERRLIACHTDRRSTKCSELMSDDRSSWLFYDSGRKLQLRLSGPITLSSGDPYAKSCWSRVNPSSRACYGALIGPGNRVDEPPPAPAPAHSEADAERAERNFAVLACRIEFLEWLVLSAGGHRRAQFHWRGDRLEAAWIAP